MPNYRESSIAGTRYQRARKIAADNPLGGVPSIHFIEEQVVVLADETVTTPLGMITETLSNPAAVFNRLDPADDSVVGTLTHQDVYDTLYSLYRHLATQRDNA